MLPPPLFRNRAEAGRALARQLRDSVSVHNPIVLALPRGGVPVAFEIALALRAELDVFLVRKLGVPGHEELAMGAIATGNIRVINKGIVSELGLSNQLIDRVAQRERLEIERREKFYRESRPPLSPIGRTSILVDDGLATGASMLAAVRALRLQSPERIIVAVPVASKEACRQIERQVDQMICAATPEPFEAVGNWYEDFSQTSDEEVRELLEPHRSIH